MGILKKVTGIGVDLVAISRFEKFEGDAAHHFLQKVFSEREIQYCFTYKKAAPHEGEVTLSGIEESFVRVLKLSFFFLLNTMTTIIIISRTTAPPTRTQVFMLNIKFINFNINFPSVDQIEMQ